MLLRLATFAPVIAALGCTGSRWAREDVDYAAKYPRHTDNVLKMTKQAVDARHVKGKGGPYAGLSGRTDPYALGGEAGAFTYPTSYLELHGGLGGLIYEGSTPISGGVIGGARLQTPTRLAPFVGVGGYGGVLPDLWEENGFDDDYDGYIDEPDEDSTRLVGAVFPEAGLHFWITPEWRLTASASYMLVADSRFAEFPMYSISLGRQVWFHTPTSDPGKIKLAHELGWNVGDGALPAEYGPPAETAPAELFEAPVLAPPTALPPAVAEGTPGD